MQTLDPLNPLMAVIALALALGISALFQMGIGAPKVQGRFVSIDGLRGYLAFFVFLHHSSIWYFYLRKGVWEVPPSNLFTHFGQSSVALFFMITGFLFFHKILEGKRKPIDWGRLYVSRFLRLTPLYLFAMVLLGVIVVVLSGGIRSEPWMTFFKNVISWILFTIPGAPDVNGVKDTAMILAGVNWSLSYEWLFYLFLPLLALTQRLVVPRRYLVLAGLGILIWVGGSYSLRHLQAFLAGVVAAYVVRDERFLRFAVTRNASWLILGAMAGALFFFSTAYQTAPMTLLFVVFVLVGGGNSFFGVLTSSVARTLGEAAYSIYLLHGISLFVVFRFVLGFEVARSLSPLVHWAVIFSLTPVLIALCFCTFLWIESPAMAQTLRLTAWLRRGRSRQ